MTTMNSKTDDMAQLKMELTPTLGDQFQSENANSIHNHWGYQNSRPQLGGYQENYYHQGIPRHFNLNYGNPSNALQALPGFATSSEVTVEERKQSSKKAIVKVLTAMQPRMEMNDTKMEKAESSIES